MQDVPIDQVDTNFILMNAAHILGNTPIGYLKEAKLAGSLFDPNSTTGAISCVFTEFYVDHQEPLAALDIFKAKRGWCLGELPEGHEFLIVLPAM